MPTKHVLLDGFEERLVIANQLINIIASCGRRFFYCQSKNSTARFAAYAGAKRVVFFDDYTMKPVPVDEGVDANAKGFSHGGTLWNLVQHIGEYVCTGKQLDPWLLGPQRQSDKSNIWGYDEVSMQKVRSEAAQLPGIFQAEEAPAEVESGEAESSAPANG